MSQVLCQSGSDVRRDTFAPTVYFTNDVKQFVFVYAFEDVSQGTCTQGVLDLYVPIEGREHDDLRFWELAPDSTHCLDARTIRQASIYEGYIWLMSAKLFDGLSRVRHLGDVQHVGLGRNDHTQTFPINGHVVDRKNFYLSQHNDNPSSDFR